MSDLRSYLRKAYSQSIQKCRYGGVEVRVLGASTKSSVFGLLRLVWVALFWGKPNRGRSFCGGTTYADLDTSCDKRVQVEAAEIHD